MSDKLVQYMFDKPASCSTCPAHGCDGYFRGQGTKPAKIAFVLEAPPPFIKEVAAKREQELKYFPAFSERAGEVLKSIVRDLCQEYPELQKIVPYYTYAVKCVVPKTTAEMGEHCSTLTQNEIFYSGADVIVALGAAAMRQMGLKEVSVREARGTIQKTTFGGKEFILIPTYSPGALVKKENGGLIDLFKEDLRKALQLCLHSGYQKTPLDELTKDYVWPQTVDEVKAVCEEILDHFKNNEEDRLLGVDCETNMLEMYSPKSRVIGISFSWAHRKACTILLDHKKSPYDYKEVLPFVRKVLESDIPKVYHNYKFDYQALELRLGLDVANVKWDTMLVEHLLYEDKKGYYGLKEIVGDYAPEYRDYEDSLWAFLEANPFQPELTTETQALDDVKKKLKGLPSKKDLKARWGKEISASSEYIQLLEFTALKNTHANRVKELKADFKAFEEAQAARNSDDDEAGQSRKTFESVPTDIMARYASIDADVTRQIAVLQLKKIRSTNQVDLLSVLRNFSIPASRTLGRMSYDGFRIDLEYLAVIEKALDAKIIQLEGELYDTIGRRVDLGSNGTIIDILTAERGLVLTKLTKKKTAFAVDKDVLADLFKKTGDVFVGKFLEYRKCAKARDTYIEGFKNLSAIDGCIHTSFHINGTSTGRLSSAKPNLQNLPAELAGFPLKKLFIPDLPDEEYAFNADYKAAEIRVLTAYANDPGLIQAIKDGLDVHSYVASKIYGIPYEEFKKRGSYAESDPEKFSKLDLMRTFTKKAVFLTIYGGGAEALLSQLKPVKEDVSIEDCEATMNLLLNGFPVIKQYMAVVELKVRRDKYVTSKFGRRRRFPLAAYDWKAMSEARTKAVNMPVQSTSSDIVLGQLIEMDNEIRAIGGKLKLTVHDSIVGTIRREKVEHLGPFLKKWGEDRVGERYPWLPVPFELDAGFGPTYGECDTDVVLM